VDCAMVDGAAILTTMFYTLHSLAAGWTSAARTCSILARPITKPTRRRRQVRLGRSRSSRSSMRTCSRSWESRMIRCSRSRTSGPTGRAMKERMTQLIPGPRRATNGARCIDGSDICFAPVLSLTEAPKHPHNVARGTFRRGGGNHATRSRAALFGDPGAGGFAQGALIADPTLPPALSLRARRAKPRPQ
jgi:alpha-methylacyl-CoA racemase